MSSAPTIGYLKARLEGEEYFFNGRVWSGEAKHVSMLNEMKDVWHLQHYSLSDMAEVALATFFPHSDWEILEVKPDMRDQAEPPSGEDEFW